MELIRGFFMIVGGFTVLLFSIVAIVIGWLFVKDYGYWRSVSKKSLDFNFDYPTDPFVPPVVKEKPTELAEPKTIETVEDSVIVVPGPGEQTVQPSQATETPKPQYLSAVSSAFRGWDKSTISACSVDPQMKLNEIYVNTLAVTEHKVVGDSTFSESKTDANSVKLVRSGTGFRIYDHPTVPNGKWLSCR